MHHHHHHPSLHDGHVDEDRVQDWITQHFLEPDLNTFIKLEHVQQQQKPLERPDSPLEDFTWSSSAASSTPALSLVLVREEDQVHDVSVETDVENDFDALKLKHESLPPMTFKRGRSSVYSSNSSSSGSEEPAEQRGVPRIEKPLPPRPPPTPPNLTENPIVAPSRSRHPSIVSLAGYHLPSSVQLSNSSTPSPRTSLVSLSRQSSITGHSSAHGHVTASHTRQSSMSRQPSLPLLSPSASSTLFEEDDRPELQTPEGSDTSPAAADSGARDREREQLYPNLLHTKAERRRSGKFSGTGVTGSCRPILKHARSDSKSDYRSVSGHTRGLSRSTSGSGASLLSYSSSLRRQSSVNSIYSSHSGSSSSVNRPITRHASAGNLLTRVQHAHSPSLPCSTSPLPPHSLPIRRSVASHSSSGYATSSTHISSIHFADGGSDATSPNTSSSSYSPKHVPSASMSLSLLAPPPTATFPSGGIEGSSSGSATVSTPRNRDAVYIDAVDSEEVQKRLAALLTASSTSETGDSHPTEISQARSTLEEDAQVIEYYEAGKSGVYINADMNVEKSVASSSRFESPASAPVSVFDEQVPEVEQSRWSPASSTSDLPLSPVSTPSKHRNSLGLGAMGMASVPGIGLGLVGAPPSSKRKSKAKDGDGKKRKSITSKEDEEVGTHDEGAPKRPGQRQRLASFIVRAIGGNVGSSTPTTPHTPVASEPSPPETSESSSPVSPITDHSLNGSSSPTPSMPPQRVRALSNANKPSPLRIEVTPFSQHPSAGPSTASTARARAISLNSGPTTPVTPSNTPTPHLPFVGRMRSESQVSTTSTVSSTSSSSIGLGVMLDKFPSPGDNEDDSRWEVRGSVVPEEDEEDARKSDESDPEEDDDGAYYVKAFEKGYERRSTRDDDDGEVTETEPDDSVLKSPLHSKPVHPRLVIKEHESSRPPSQIHIPTSSRPSSVARSVLAVPLPLSPPPSLSPSPVLPVNSLRMPSPSRDLLDSDPFAANSTPVPSPGSGSASPAPYFHNHPSPSGTKPPAGASNYPYPSRSLQASKSMGTLPKMSSPVALHADNGAKSLISPGDLPPSKVWNVRNSGYSVSPPRSPYYAPPSPASPLKKSTAKSKLRMSVSGLVSRFRRDSPTDVPLPPPTPAEEMLPTPVMTPVVPFAPIPPLIASRSAPPEVEDEDDSDEEEDDSEVIIPPFSPTLPSNPKRKSLGLGLSSGEDGAAVGGSRLSLSSIRSRKAKKRRLVISGVAVGDEQAYEAVKDWCKTFGPIRQITRKPNGSLHVNFRDASVAETVCRVQATVNIRGAGSVTLGWYTGKDRSKDGVDLQV